MMSPKHKVAFLVATTSALVFGSGAVLAEGNVENGRQLSEQLCVSCHVVGPDGPAKLHPPSFASISVFRSEEQILGRIIYPPLHVSMPELGYQLTPDNVSDLVAYIVSLEGQ